MAASLPVVIASNQSALTVAQATATNLKAEVVGTGTFAVQAASTLAAETTKVIGTVRCLGNAGAIFDAATGAAVPANVIYNGARAATSNPTNATSGNAVGLMADKAGRLVVTPYHIRELVGIQQTTITNSSAETTIVTADATNFLDITNLEITSGTATAFTVTIKDSTAGTTRKIYSLTGAVGAGVVVNFNPPLPQAAVNNNWTATLSSNAVTCYLNVTYTKNL